MMVITVEQKKYLCLQELKSSQLNRIPFFVPEIIKMLFGY